MRRSRPGSNDEMVGLFLLAELDSPRYGSRVREGLARSGWTEDLIRSPDLADPHENAHRAGLLREGRGWQGSRYILQGLPADLEWRYVELDRDEAGDVLGSRWEPWLTLADPDRRVATAAARALAPLAMDSASADLVDRAQSVARAYIEDTTMLPPIVVAPARDAKMLVAVEGHTRLLGWYLSGLERPLEVLVGTGDLSRWRWG